MKKPSSINPHLCPDCARMDCEWWNGLHPPAGAITGIRPIREYAKGKGSKRITVDRVIVIKCPRFIKEKKAEKTASFDPESYRNLVNAVIETAAIDYKKALEKWDEVEILNIYRFFMSEYFYDITNGNIDARYILKKLEQEVDNDRKRVSKRRKPYRAMY